MKNIGVIGLGNMGRGIALSLKRAGFSVTGFDKAPAAASLAEQEGIDIAASVAALTKGCDAIVLSLPTAAIVKAVISGTDGIAEHASAGLMIIDTTTSDAETSRALATELRHKKITFLDVPVSGGALGALKGDLTMFIGGMIEDVERATPVLAAMGSKRFHIGATGAGNIAKIVNNLLTASHLLTAAEAFRLANAAGVKTENLLEAVNAGSGRSGVTINNFPNRVINNKFDSGFSMQLMRKDVKLAMSLAEEFGVNLPVISQIGTLWELSAASIADHEDYNRIVQFETPEKLSITNAPKACLENGA